MIKRFLIPVVIVVAVVAAGTWWFLAPRLAPDELVLYGNVDLRQVALAFNSSERIDKVLVKEGDIVHQGDVIAVLDKARLQPQVDQAEAQVAAQQAIVQRLHNGSRPAKVEEAQAKLALAKADEVNAQLTYKRLKTLGTSASQQEVDSAKAALDAANARVDAAEKAVELLVAGPRQEEIAQAEANLRARQAHLALLRHQLEDATLKAPVAGVVRARLLEPGEIASPSRPVVSIAVVDPKWVRAYVTEKNLGRIRPGMKGYVTVDAFQHTRFSGYIGFISPVAEFTPKNVQTPDLRTSLVYAVRIFVDDPANLLRLGMPATVHLPWLTPPSESAPAASGAVDKTSAMGPDDSS